jgi:hypothetical protein
MRSIDVADSPLASYWTDIASELDGAERREFEEFVESHSDMFEDYGRKVAFEVIRYVFNDVAKRDHAAISLMAFYIALGFTSITVESLEKMGDRLGVTKQAVSKELTYFRDLYGVRALGSAKSEEARETYRDVQIERYDQQKAAKPEETHGIGFNDIYGTSNN